jgi:Glycosyltransferase Family 4
MTGPRATDRPVIFVGNARDYHAMDWFRSAQQVCAPRPLLFVTDLIESEGHARLVGPDDPIVHLFNVDRFLLRRQSRLGHVWRNAVKFGLLPVQAWLLRRVHRRHPDAAYHAHTMYYMLACWIAGVPCVGTPQGSEILVRPRRSRVYRWFATRALRAARGVTVDSEAMARGVRELAGRDAMIVQNGIDIAAIRAAGEGKAARSGVLSVRAIDPNYRIDRVVDARDASVERPALTFCYPFREDGYRATILPRLTAADRDLGRLGRADLYREMGRALLVVSIPTSDSSPRSVYESVFSGAAVAVARNAYIDALPACMRARLLVVDPAAPDWLDDALARARALTAVPYQPSEEALDQFDQRRSMARVAAAFYGR